MTQEGKPGVQGPRFPPNPFPFGWFQATYSDELGAGQVVPLHYFGREFVLWREEGGTPHLMDAFCAHMGAHIGHGGHVEGSGVRCPFHHWKYDGTGRCVDVPYSDMINRHACLTTYPLVERNGLLMMWWHPQGEPPMWDIPVIPEYGDPGWTDYRRHEWRIATHWQEMVENAVDTSHFRYLHGAAAVPTLDDLEVDGYLLRSNAKHVLTTSEGPRPGSIDTHMHGPGFGTVRFTIEGIAETLFLQALTPVSDSELHARFSFLRKGRGARAMLADGLAREVIRQIDADAPIWEHKIYRARPNLVKGDGPVMAFRRWTRQFCAGDAEGSR